MNRLQNFGELKKEIAQLRGADAGVVRSLGNMVDYFQREHDSTQQNIQLSGIQKGEMWVRRPGVVRVKLKWAVEKTDYKVDSTLLTRDPETNVLSLASSSPLYDRRRKDEFFVDCSVAGTLKWEIKPF